MRLSSIHAVGIIFLGLGCGGGCLATSPTVNRKFIYDGLRHERVVVVCRDAHSNPVNEPYFRKLAAAVGSRLVANDHRIKVVTEKEITEHFGSGTLPDERQLGIALQADKVLLIDVETHAFYSGNNLASDADVCFYVRDMDNPEKLVWSYRPPTIKIQNFSMHPAVEDKNIDMRNQFIYALAEDLAGYFYEDNRRDPVVRINWSELGIGH